MFIIIKKNLLNLFADIHGNIGEIDKKTFPNKYKSVTEIIRHLSDDVMENALKFVTEKNIETNNNNLIAIDNLIKQKDGNLENVSDIVVISQIMSDNMLSSECKMMISKEFHKTESLMAVNMTFKQLFFHVSSNVIDPDRSG